MAARPATGSGESRYRRPIEPDPCSTEPDPSSSEPYPSSTVTDRVKPTMLGRKLGTELAAVSACLAHRIGRLGGLAGWKGAMRPWRFG